MRPSLADFFHSSHPARDKFLARLFGLFSEDLVRDWCNHPQAPFADLGRPTLWAPDEPRGATLDFTLRDRRSGKTYAAEMKVELEFDGYKYMTLERLEQLAHHRLPAFQRFLELAREPTAYEVRVKGKPMPVDGAILVWGAVSDKGREEVTRATNLHDVLSLDAMLADLRAWQPPDYVERVRALRLVANELFDWLG